MVWMLRDSMLPVAPAPGKWPSAPLFGKGVLRLEGRWKGRGKSKLHGQLAADVRGGVAQRWNSFRVADYPGARRLRSERVVRELLDGGDGVQLSAVIADGGH
jgi:hypothetical protein